MRTNRSGVVLVLVLFVGLLAATDQTPTAAAADTNAEKTDVELRSAGPYCGLYSIYAALKFEGKQVQFNDLLKPKYIGDSKGSSLAELQQAAQDFGLQTAIVGNLNTDVLRHIAEPVVLHVKANADASEYDHFILFLGTKDGQAQVYDPPKPLQLIQFDALAPRWNGTGLIVSATPIDTSKFFAPSKWRFGMYAIAILLVVAGMHGVKRWWGKRAEQTRQERLKRSSIEGAVLCSVVLIWGFGYNFLSGEGLLAHAEASAAVQQANLPGFLPKLDLTEVRKLQGTTVRFIDARHASDYADGHLPGAINIPVDTLNANFNAALATIPTNTPLVIYCQSDACPYAGILSKRLSAAGYANLRLFPGGWDEWKSAQQSGH
jgi:rhodanese-related sulfurtransferase